MYGHSGLLFSVFLGTLKAVKILFANTLFLMAIITVIIGLIPSVATIGFAATIIFSICRILQGSIFGAEVPGAVTFLAEHIEEKKQGFHLGLMSALTGAGVLLGSFITWIVTKLLNEAAMVAWGFRIPFLLGGLLAVVGFIIRKNVAETPKFLKLKQAKVKLSKRVIKEHIGQIINVVGILLFPAAWISLQIVFPVYLHNFYHYAYPDIYLAMTCSYVMSTFMVPVFGWLSDKVGRKTLLIAGGAIAIIFIYPVFSLLESEGHYGVFVFYLFTQTVAAIFTASYYILLPQAFKTVFRYTGTAFSYNLTFSLTALLPLIINYIYGVAKKPSYLIVILVSLAMISIISAFIFKVKHDDNYEVRTNN